MTDEPVTATAAPCSHGPDCPLPWSLHDWSYEADRATASTIAVCPRCEVDVTGMSLVDYGDHLAQDDESRSQAVTTTSLLDEYANVPGVRHPEPTLTPGVRVTQRAQAIARQILVDRHRGEYDDLYRRVQQELRSCGLAPAVTHQCHLCGRVGVQRLRAVGDGLYECVGQAMCLRRRRSRRNRHG